MGTFTADWVDVGILVRSPIKAMFAEVGATYTEDRRLLGSTFYNLRIETTDERLRAFIDQMRRFGALPE